MSDRMNPERKAQWVLDLRSGNFRQGHSSLKTESGAYCCLGVLCEAAYQAGATEHWEAENAEAAAFYGDESAHAGDPQEDGYGSWSTLPYNVQEWAGLHDRDPMVEVPSDHPRFERTDTSPFGWDDASRTYTKRGARVSSLNDGGWTFEEIADLIEAQL